jgi:hypothetical protein
MEELAKLGNSTLKRKPRRNPVPRAVSYWLFFKRHLLEQADVRAQFEAAPLNINDFRQLVKATANPRKWGPSFCRQRRVGNCVRMIIVPPKLPPKTLTLTMVAMAQRAELLQCSKIY